MLVVAVCRVAGFRPPIMCRGGRGQVGQLWCEVRLGDVVGAGAGEPGVDGQVGSGRVCTRVNAATRSVVQGQVAESRQMRRRPVVMTWPAVWNKQ